ncbi:MAG: hypothetical protein ACUVQI_06185 [Thermochromatium sp.]
MHAQSAIEYHSVEDHRRWEGDWDLIGGIPLAISPSPVIEHQRLGARILRRLAEALVTALYKIDVEFSPNWREKPPAKAVGYTTLPA